MKFRHSYDAEVRVGQDPCRVILHSKKSNLGHDSCLVGITCMMLCTTRGFCSMWQKMRRVCTRCVPDLNIFARNLFLTQFVFASPVARVEGVYWDR